MPMFEAEIDNEDGGGEVVDLETAFSDGEDSENVDLKTMIESLSLRSIEIPPVFICPISLEPMQDPVTLCTGQTYERSNILKWLSLGRYICPTTMQELWDDSLTPNNTLHHLIFAWFSQKYSAVKKRSEDDFRKKASNLHETLKTAKGRLKIQTLKELRLLLKPHSSASKTFTDSGGASFLTSLLDPFTSHAIGSEAIGILVNLTLDADCRSKLMEPAKVSLMVDMLNDGCNHAKVNCARLIEILIEGDSLWSKNVWSLSLLVGVLKLVKDWRHPNGVQAGLGLIKTMIRLDEVVTKWIISINAVHQLVELLPYLNSQCLDLSLSVLDALCSNPEGAMALKQCPNTIPNLVRLLMSVQERCTKLGISILMTICKLDPEECASAAVEAGLAAKLLLVMQSGCDREVKQRSAELLKLCSLNYPTTIFISKCKLTKTLQ